MKLAFRVDFDSKKRLFSCPSIERLPGTEPVLAESRSISISCVRVLKMPRTIIRAYGHALPRRYAEERILPSFRANEPLRSLYPLCFCATATDAPYGTKVKGFSKRADSYWLFLTKKKRGTAVLFDHRSFYYRTLSILEYLIISIHEARETFFFHSIIIHFDIFGHAIIHHRRKNSGTDYCNLRKFLSYC